jgi:hypothetical protein
LKNAALLVPAVIFKQTSNGEGKIGGGGNGGRGIEEKGFEGIVLCFGLAKEKFRFESDSFGCIVEL